MRQLYFRAPVRFSSCDNNGQDFRGSDPSHVIQVTEGVQSNLTCHVSGGVPATTHTTIVCDGLPLSNSSFVFTRHMDGKLCICSGSHVSGCYNKTTAVKLDVACESVI